ncbi:Hypothetical_protein [Hexamita inflata]|uniref:Hypothetical_protein n=1 Tax=Hexamita inflata TaxID=28002 RepID=A0AA86UTT2_9EUKA|nr:Hypothetical protein HINF_LOCUS55304 [Hexamita inflata]
MDDQSNKSSLAIQCMFLIKLIKQSLNWGIEEAYVILAMAKMELQHFEQFLNIQFKISGLENKSVLTPLLVSARMLVFSGYIQSQPITAVWKSLKLCQSGVSVQWWALEMLF